ncbi:MAG: hypothetical protein PHY45_05445 [Rhodocyclaceae bacterium]|nr:hypothetical protein [Rhodocyclaceae bacterium]
MADELMHRRFADDLPGYVNHTLGDEERAWVETYLHAHQDAKGDVELMRLLHTELAATADDRAPAAGLDELLSQIRQSGHGRRSWWRRVNEFFRTLPLSPALAAGLIFVQAGLIAVLVAERAAPDERMGLTRSAAPDLYAGPVLRVNFKPETKEADIRFLLVRCGCRIVGGPGQLGAYFVAASSQRLPSAVAELRASTWVESAEVLPRLPEQPQ